MIDLERAAQHAIVLLRSTGYRYMRIAHGDVRGLIKVEGNPAQ